MDSVEDAVAVVTPAPTPEDSFARRLNEALAAISQAQTPAVEDDLEQVHADPVRPETIHPNVVEPAQFQPEAFQPEPVVREPVRVEAPATYTPATRVSAYTAAREADAEPEDEESRVDESTAENAEREALGRPKPEAARKPDAPVSAGSAWRKWLAALDKMPPIRLPIGPAVPWRYGLPALLVLVAVVAVMSRPSGARPQENRSVLPSQEVYQVQADGPLFATPSATAAATDDGGASPVLVARQPAPIGVQEPAGAGFDLLDIGIKLAAVLGLAYGSLVLLKKAGVGGAGRLSPGALNGADGMRVVGTVTLAPNRSVHALRVPDGRTLLIGATPNSVNLLTELGELDDEDAVEASGLLDGIRARLH